jgi:hypothetical protein
MVQRMPTDDGDAVASTVTAATDNTNKEAVAAMPKQSAAERASEPPIPHVTPPAAPTPKRDLTSMTKKSSSSNRKRIVSLDRGQELMLQQKEDDDDDDNSTVTSDGESSYFAKHLPSPKSGRLSFTAGSDTGSISSAPARTRHQAGRESDASLSFSDDESGDGMVEHSSSPIPEGNNLHFRGIARMHSASSLVSADESEAELQNNGQRSFNSGQRRPHDNPGHYFFAATPPQVSPPTILQQFPSAGIVVQPGVGAVHPQPLSGAAWMAAGKEAYDLTQQSLEDSGRGSHATLPLVYSEDEDMELMAGGGGGTRSNGGVFHGVRGGSNNGVPQQQPSLEGDGAASLAASRGAVAGAGGGDDMQKEELTATGRPVGGYKVYFSRWIMLMYMSLLNLLSDWTCYSVAPIAVLTSEAFGSIDPEQLVVIFLGANALATACEPIILSRLGLRKTVVFGAFLLMVGSIIKSGGFPPIIESDLQKGQGEWRVYVGFFMVGLSQPLYQCTPALLSASWFPERERTMATGVALNANQLGIGCAFIFGTLLVGDSDDIVPYFGLLSLISTITFIGSLLQFDDAPPTAPSDTARVIRGTMELNLPDADAIWQSVRNLGTPRQSARRSAKRIARTNSSNQQSGTVKSARRRAPSNRSSQTPSVTEDGSFARTSAPAPSSIDARVGRKKRRGYDPLAPSPMMPGPVSPTDEQDGAGYDDIGYTEGPDGQGMPPGAYPDGPPGAYPYHPQQGAPPYVAYAAPPPGYGPPPPPHQMQYNQDPYWAAQQQYQQQQAYQYGSAGYGGSSQQGGPPPPGYGYYQQPNPYYYPPPQHFPPQPLPPHYYSYDEQNAALMAPPSYIEEFAEPTLTLTDHHLDINIRDDQIILSARACFARPGFVHALVVFTVSGIVINTLSTYMDYLVRLNGAGREYVGIIGGSFQIVIMISSLIIGKQTDKTRAYYSVTIAMLVLGAFGLAECGVSLDADRGGDLRWALIIVAALVGPLQPVSTELGVEVAYPLSENTVLVIQQLFSNLLSALFIPFFKALKDVGTMRIDATELYERPEYTFSFYLLIVIHAAVTVFFATFNGRYLRYEHELVKKENERLEEAKAEKEAFDKQFAEQWKDQYGNDMDLKGGGMYSNERQPLMTPNQVI